jgi:hypothetical protein
VSAGVFAYVVWKLSPAELAASLGGVRWWLLCVAVVLGVMSVALQSLRWWYLLRPARVRYRDVVQATYLGSLCSQLLPLRSGEIIRGLVVSRRSHRPFAGVLSTEAVERLADGVAMSVLVFVALHGLRLPAGLAVAPWILGAGVSVLVVLLAFVVWRERSVCRRLRVWVPGGKLRARVRRVLLEIVEGLGSVRSGLSVAVCLVIAVGMAGLQVTILWLALRAYGLDLGFGAAAALLAVISVGTLVPTTPGNVGGWQFFCVMGLTLLGVSQSVSAGFSLVAYSVLSLGSLLGGIVALATSPFSFDELRKLRFAAKPRKHRAGEIVSLPTIGSNVPASVPVPISTPSGLDTASRRRTSLEPGP